LRPLLRRLEDWLIFRGQDISQWTPAELDCLRRAARLGASSLWDSSAVHHRKWEQLTADTRAAVNAAMAAECGKGPGEEYEPGDLTTRQKQQLMADFGVDAAAVDAAQEWVKAAIRAAKVGTGQPLETKSPAG
jgi:hypothetical protein